jgi:hypothetical protein
MLQYVYSCYLANKVAYANEDLKVFDKDGGLGREGIRFAMEDMSGIRNLGIQNKDV